MKTLLILLGILALNTPLQAKEGDIKGYNTYDAMGCMMLFDCTDDVEQITSFAQIEKEYPTANFSEIREEAQSLISALNDSGVKVFLGPEKYFPPNHRGVYHTIGNNFFLNDYYMGDPKTLISVIRHEGWHAAQDCMAGTIDNNLIAIINPEEDVPMLWRELAERTYPPEAVPWEAEAWWAGKTEGMTIDALKACSTGTMWEEYEPTPLTRQWLEENGYIK